MNKSNLIFIDKQIKLKTLIQKLYQNTENKQVTLKSGVKIY